MERKGIVLCGGSGERLLPFTRWTSKHLLPVYNRPMVAYSLDVLEKLDIKEIALVVNPDFCSGFLDFASSLGERREKKITVIRQFRQHGMASAVLSAKDWLGDNPAVVICGDNIFHFSDKAIATMKRIRTIDNVVITHFDSTNYNDSAVVKYATPGPSSMTPCLIHKVVEKPNPRHHSDCLTGLYFLSNQAIKSLQALKQEPSLRGELELADLFNFLANASLLKGLEFSVPWFDCGTFERLLHASIFVQKITESERDYATKNK